MFSLANNMDFLFEKIYFYF